MASEYVFIDEWDVDAPIDAVFEAVSDPRTYPAWWKPVYLKVEADDKPLAAGSASRQLFKGRLPYRLWVTSEIVRLDPPHGFEARVSGDLRGRGVWTLTQTPRGVHVRFDWRVFADKPLLRVLTPVLRPLFRWNHNYAIRQAIRGLEPYLYQRANAPERTA